MISSPRFDINFNLENIFLKVEITATIAANCQLDSKLRSQIKEQPWNFALVQSFL